MELQQLTEQMLLAVTSLNRSCIPQSVQEPLKGEKLFAGLSLCAKRLQHAGRTA